MAMWMAAHLTGHVKSWVWSLVSSGSEENMFSMITRTPNGPHVLNGKGPYCGGFKAKIEDKKVRGLYIISPIGGGFNYFLFSPRSLGKWSPFWLAYIFKGVGWNHQLDKILRVHIYDVVSKYYTDYFIWYNMIMICFRICLYTHDFCCYTWYMIYLRVCVDHTSGDPTKCQLESFFLGWRKSPRILRNMELGEWNM